MVYNTAGSILCASRISSSVLVDTSVYRIEAKSEQETAFLIAILNADALQESYRKSRRSDRHFHTHFWHKIPIPRYDESNPLHVKLVELCFRAEKIAQSVQVEKRKKKRKALREDGVSGEIDTIVRELFPHHTSS